MAWLVAVLVGAGVITGPLSLWLVLRFLRHVYDKGGPAHLTALAAAIRTAKGPRHDHAERVQIDTGQPTSDTPEP